MPYSKQHKQQTREKILHSAFNLFTAKGFDGVTVNQLMQSCKLTRGAFYAHFTSKADLYSEVIKHSASSSKLAELKPDDVTDKQWLGELLDGYLSIEHVNGTTPCPLAFLATDIVTRDIGARLAYANAYQGMNQAVINFANSYTECDPRQVLALTAMIIGAVAIARTMDDQQAIISLLNACRSEAGLKLGGI
ncbi:MAG: TetR/AcrR family transcriptional regulator [Pseudomonadales bacterium]|nr:TetR/AcrR family transcriptional regulator [Pseudomonadales bacterium]NRA18265.1 TetR/AcrR family transcriptional regulator [Oceanospirillaceae bacterium]